MCICIYVWIVCITFPTISNIFRNVLFLQCARIYLVSKEACNAIDFTKSVCSLKLGKVDILIVTVIAH